MKDHPCRKFRFFIPLFVVAVIGLVSWAVLGLWNSVLVAAVVVKAITYWQAVGILILSKILFGGFPGRRGCGGGRRWKKRMMMEKWESLSPEERDKMREEMRKRFGDWHRSGWCDESSDEPGEPGGPVKA